MTDTTPSPLRYAIGDLGPARRHVARLMAGRLPANPLVLQEIAAALDRCVRRLEAMDSMVEAAPALDPEFMASCPLPWTIGDGVLLDAEGQEVPMYSDAMLRFVLALMKQ